MSFPVLVLLSAPVWPVTFLVVFILIKDERLVTVHYLHAISASETELTTVL
ncbi:hypothetical protein HNR64_002689 [Spongiibacter marinus]|nr:hypothetical protein [Spongiibacter marinus]